MRSHRARLVAPVLALPLALGLGACSDEEEPAQEVEQGAEEAEQGAEEVGSEAEQGAEEAEQEVEGED